MLQPTKHSHPDKTVIYMSFLLLKRLKSCRIDQLDSLLKFAKNNIVGSDVLFLPALSFLYLLGVIEYRSKTDAIEYIGPHETI
jgi:hypothetical protein